MIDWIALIFTTLGTYLYSLGKVSQLRIGFILLTVGNLLWLIWAFNNNIYSMIVTSLMFGTLNIKAYYKWKKYDYV